MNNVLHNLNPIHWPIWSKLAFGLALAAIIPSVILFNLVVINADLQDRERLDIFLRDTAEDHQIRLDEELEDALQSLEDMVNNRVFRQDIVTILMDEETDSSTRIALLNILESRLIQSGLYDEIHFTDPEGQIVLRIGEVAGIFTSDASETRAYLAGVNAEITGETQILTVYSDNDINRVDVTHVIRDSSDTTLGYVIAALRIDPIVEETLIDTSTLIPVTTYMVNRQGQLFAPELVLDKARESIAANPIERLYLTSSGSEIYNTEAGTLLRHFKPTRNNRFLVVSETSSSFTLIPPLVVFLRENVLAFIIVDILFIFLVIFMARLIGVPLTAVRQTLDQIRLGNLQSSVSGLERRDEIGDLARAVADLRAQFRDTITDMQQRIAARQRDIEATQVVSRYAATQRDMQRLMDEVVTLVANVFPNIYHAQIFLIDSERRNAILRASTGEPGQRLLERGHRLGVGSVSVIGQVTAEGRSVVAVDTSSSDVHRQNQFLPDTRSELATPLRVGDQIIGALDVQSRESNTFNDEQIRTLETLADQIAISLDNARLYEESLRRLQELGENTRRTTIAAWEDYMYSAHAEDIVIESGVNTGASRFEDLYAQAIASGETVVGEATNRDTIPIVVPITLRGQSLGAIEWDLPSAEFDEDKLQLAEELVSRLAISLDNARLFEQSQRSVNRERVVNNVAAQLVGQTDIETILQTAVREVGKALHAPDVSIRLNTNIGKSGTNGSSQKNGSS